MNDRMTDEQLDAADLAAEAEAHAQPTQADDDEPEDPAAPLDAEGPEDDEDDALTDS